ncbi:MAG: PQQ-dependent sugar dehydrogenase [Nocardioides sp.]
MRPRTALTILGLVAGLLAPVAVTAVPAPSAPGRAAPTVSVVPVASGLAMPTDIASPPGSTDLYILEKCGVIRLLRGGTLSRVGSLRKRVDCNGERGLLSLAFHPDFARNHRAFVYYTRRDTGDVQLSRLRLVNDAIKPGSVKPMLRIRHRQASNHNGGKIAFDKAGLLYVSTGDGGGGGNQFGHAQDRRSLLGKVLRLDVDHGWPYTIPADNPLRHKQGRPEIWAIGLRNPWRMAFDPASRSMWVGDVGQDTVEEVDRLRVTRIRLLNLGWSHYEGNRVFDRGERLRGGKLVKPVLSYRHPVGESIIGGAVYRGSRSPALKGYYVYGDLNGWIAGFSIADPSQSFRVDPGTSLLTISKAGDKELYAGYADGTVYRITAD